MRIINLGLSFVLAGAFSITAQAQTVNFSTLQIQMQKACPVVWEDLAVPINLVAIPFSNVWQSNQVDESEFIALYMTDYSVSNADAQLVANNVSAVAAVCGSYRIGLIDTLVANNALDTLIATETAASPDSLVVKPGAPNSSLVIASDGDLGVGTSSPGTLAYGEEASVHIKRLDGNASLLIEEANSSTAARGMLELKNNGGSYLTMKNTATNKEWFLSHENQSAGRFIISDGVNDGPELTLTTDGDLSLEGSLSASDLVVKGAGHKLLELESTDSGSPQLRLISDIADIRRVLAMNSARQIKSQIELGDNGIKFFGASATDANTFASIDAAGLQSRAVDVDTVSTGGHAELSLTNPAQSWTVRSHLNSNLVFINATASLAPVMISGSAQTGLLKVGFDASGNANSGSVSVEGNMTLTGTLTTAGGTCGGGCDAVFGSDYKLPSIEEHAADMWDKKFLPNVGPTIENEPINVSDKLGRMLNELEIAHIFIEKLQAQIHSNSTSSERQISHLTRVIEKLEERLNTLEK
ncbi:hypothetical protein NBRC116583_31960 [Arenicella sp. 4NH20-0111]|uniref:hypothetical protein n=1 Tax=Arenicella sp. 4NH20-0111 TaxID=3127648 RepID=UPI00310A60EE